jgi:hypothetical protein
MPPSGIISSLFNLLLNFFQFKSNDEFNTKVFFPPLSYFALRANGIKILGQGIMLRAQVK